MCGIAGLVDCAGELNDPADALRCMERCLAHRGPDDSGCWFDEQFRVGLAHRRLAIVDLGPTGAQPMTSASGRFVLVHNGEVYNFSALRRELESLGHRFRGKSDTEVMLAAFEQWGVESALTRMVGMFAFAVVDRHEAVLWLVRDRLGIKPLVYGRLAAHPDAPFVFASELSAIERLPGFAQEIDRDAIAAYLRLLYVPAPWTIDRGIRKLPPGHLLRHSLTSGATEERCWWDAIAVARAGLDAPIDDEREAMDLLEPALLEAVRLRLVSDVPLGAFLSGGIDSSTVVALMQEVSPTRVRTFTIGFDEPSLDESAHARAVAEALGTDHLELRVTGEAARAVVPRLGELYDEPFADSSQIPTCLVSQLAREHVTVALSGDGGDEIFGGYHRHLHLEEIWRRSRALPAPMRRLLASAALSTPAPAIDVVSGALGPLLPRRWRRRRSGEQLHKAAMAVRAPNLDEAYRRVIACWGDAERLVIGSHGSHDRVRELQGRLDALQDLSVVRRMMLLDQLTYLPDDILVKVDRASMAVGLEARVPLLDHRVVELAWRIAPRLHVRDGVGKRLLRRVVGARLPASILDRPKSGFAVPLVEWLRGPLRPWAEALLQRRRIEHDGLLEPGPVERAWRHVRSGRGNAHAVWAILMLNAWLDARRDRVGQGAPVGAPVAEGVTGARAAARLHGDGGAQGTL